MTTNYFTPYQDGITQYKSVHMNAPLEELDEAIGGAVVGPDTNTDGSIPQWDGADSKTLKDGLTLVTSVGSPGTDTSVPTEKAVRSAISGLVSGGVGIGFEATAKPAASGEYSLILPYSMTIPANSSGSGFYNKTNPSAEVEVSIKKNGTEFATLTVSSGGSPTWANAETELDAGDRVSFVFPAQDSTWAGIIITLRGVRT